MNHVKKTGENKEDRDTVDEHEKNVNYVKKNNKTTNNKSITKEEDGKCLKSESKI